MNEWEYVSIYCLNKMESTVARYPKGVMGALFSCPYCGIIDEPVSESVHVFEPSPKLLRALELAKEAMNDVH